MCFIILVIVYFFFFNDTATTEIYTLSLHDALPISRSRTPTTASSSPAASSTFRTAKGTLSSRDTLWTSPTTARTRSEEHTSELQSRQYLVCRLLLEKKNKNIRL